MPLDSVAVAIYASKKDPTPLQCGDVSWEQLARDLQKHERTACTAESCLGHQCPHKDGLAWSPVRLKAPRRANENVLALSAAVFDLDDVTEAELAGIGAALEGYSYVFHSTHSGKGFRLVLRLSRDVTPDEWPALWRGVAKKFALRADDACKDLARLYFFPSAPQGAEVVACEGFGVSVDVDEVLRSSAAALPSLSRALAPPAPEGVSSFPPSVSGLSSPIDMVDIALAVRKLKRPESRRTAELIMAGQPLSAPGNQSNAINDAVSLLVFLLDRPLSQEHVTELLRPCIDSMEMLNGDSHEWCYEQLARNYAAASERRAKGDAQRAAEAAAFARLAGRAPASDPEEAPARVISESRASEEDSTWRAKLITSQSASGPKFATAEHNLLLILLNDPAWKGTLKFNALTKDIDLVGGPLAGVGAAVLHTETACWFQSSEYKINVGPNVVGPVLLAAARRNEYDPLKDHISALVWDRKPRADSFAMRILGTSDGQYTSLIGRKWLMSLVARAMEPGCKMDNMLILTGAYGARKSTFIETMAGEFYADESVDMRTKEGSAFMAKFWLIEQAELSHYRGTDAETAKGFLSKKVDRFRPPYGKVIETFPRRACLVGSSNDDDILSEPNRREWVLRVGDIDIRALKLERDQLLAEALHYYLEGFHCAECPTWAGLRCPKHAWWLEGEEMKEVMSIATEFAMLDPITDAIAAWWTRQSAEKRPREFALAACLMEALGCSREQLNTKRMQDGGRALKRFGFMRHQVHRGGMRTWVYSPSRQLLEAPADAKPEVKNVVQLRS